MENMWEIYGVRAFGRIEDERRCHHGQHTKHLTAAPSSNQGPLPLPRRPSLHPHSIPPHSPRSFVLMHPRRHDLHFNSASSMMIEACAEQAAAVNVATRSHGGGATPPPHRRCLSCVRHS